LLLVAYPAEPNRLLAAGNIWSGLAAFLTTNGGKNWTKVKVFNDSGSRIYAAALAPSNVNTLYVSGRNSSGNAVFFKSTNGGAKWSQMAVPSASAYINSLAVHPTSPNTIYATTSSAGGTFKSTDGGASWTKLENTTQGGNCIVVNPSNPNEIFMGSDSGVDYSADGGKTWTDLSAGLAAKSVNWIEIDGPGRMVYAGIYGGGICRRSF